jgi:hypothetical protein
MSAPFPIFRSTRRSADQDRRAGPNAYTGQAIGDAVQSRLPVRPMGGAPLRARGFELDFETQRQLDAPGVLYSPAVSLAEPLDLASCQYLGQIGPESGVLDALLFYPEKFPDTVVGFLYSLSVEFLDAQDVVLFNLGGSYWNQWSKNSGQPGGFYADSGPVEPLSFHSNLVGPPDLPGTGTAVKARLRYEVNVDDPNGDLAYGWTVTFKGGTRRFVAVEI